MSKVKAYQLRNIKQCKFKAYISQFDFKTLDNKSEAIRKVYKGIINDYDFFRLSNEELKDYIIEKLDDKYFLTKQEKQVEINIIFKHLLRYQDYEKQLNRKIINKKIYGNVIIGNNEIELSADLVVDNGNNIELIKFKTSATKLSYKARTEKNLPENDIELFLLKKLGEDLYKEHNKPISSSYYHLKGKEDEKDIYHQFLEDKRVLIANLGDLQSIVCNDKKEQKAIDKQIKQIKDVLYFNNSTGNNIITYDYDKNLIDEVSDLLNVDLNFNSEKCESSDCDFCNYSTLCKCSNQIEQMELQQVEEVQKSSGEVRLTEPQKEVVSIEEGNYRTNAVAGSGKSTTMVMRTIELFKKGYTPNDILMITFTNKGCEELKEKINYWIKFYDIKNIKPSMLSIFTFNSFGDYIISKEWSRLGFTNKPQLATIIDINDIIKDLLEEYNDISWLNYKNPLMNFPNSKGAFKQLLIYFNLIKSFNYDVESFNENVILKEKDIVIDESLEKSNLIFEIYNKFNDKLKENNLLQYQDQILYLNELFEKYPSLVNTYGYKHIIVDEYQDTDFTQVKLLHMLKQFNNIKSLMVVGDSSQAIYSFRNTTPENIINFHKEFDNVKDIFLLDNFRSTPEICRVANELDKLNTKRIDKEIIGRKSSGKVPELLKFKSLEDENNYIVKLIEEKVNQGIPLHEICYIARTKKELLEVQKCLNEKQIPNVIEASELYLDNTNVQCILNLANFFRNNEKNYYLMEYLNVVNKELGLLKVDEIKELITQFKEGIMCDVNSFEDEENKEELKIKYFYDMISPIIEKDLVAKSFIENIQKLKFYTFNELLVYLYKVILYKDESSIEKDDKKLNAVVLTTAHSSKGKEWSIVINSINNYKYEGLEIDTLEEERRLLFVSITRAKDELYITYNTNENKSRNKGKYCLFANELTNVKVVELT